MNSRSLEYIVALHETGSLHAAAHRCHATPGTVSAQISRMESYLGVRIFVSRSDPAVLTEQGLRILPEMSKAVAQLREVRRVAMKEQQSLAS